MNTTTAPGSRLPTSIPEYLDQLRAALAGADKAMIQDAVYDAEEYLRSELAENPGKSQAEVIASVAGSYGALSSLPNGIWTYQLDNSVPATHALAQGEVVGQHLDPRAGGRRQRFRLATFARGQHTVLHQKQGDGVSRLRQAARQVVRKRNVVVFERVARFDQYVFRHVFASSEPFMRREI